MVYRDPETGKFVSGTDENHCFEDLELVHGMVAHRVDAADLGGGEQSFRYNEEATVVDFGELLDQHEVGEVVAGRFAQSLSAPTTATAEGFVYSTTQITSDPSFNWRSVVATPLSGSHNTDDSVDMLQQSAHDNEILFQISQAATGSNRDTASGTAAGSDIAQTDEFVDFRNVYGGGPVYDEDDELHVTAQFQTDNIDDHRVLLTTNVSLAVKEWDVDECPVMSRRR